MTKKQVVQAEEALQAESNNEEQVTVSIPPYLRRVIDNKPEGGDNGVVYAGGYGWVCEYPDGQKELLEELPGLLSAFENHHLDKFGQPLVPGAIIRTNLTVAIVKMLSLEDLKLLAAPLGITEGDQKQLVVQLIEKLQLK